MSQKFKNSRCPPRAKFHLINRTEKKLLCEMISEMEISHGAMLDEMEHYDEELCGVAEAIGDDKKVAAFLELIQAKGKEDESGESNTDEEKNRQDSGSDEKPGGGREVIRGVASTPYPGPDD